MLERVRPLNADYARAIDDDRLEAWPEFFTEPCLYKITTADNHAAGSAAGVIYADSKGMLEDRVAALREANIFERQRYRHLVGLPSLGRRVRRRAARRDPVPGRAHHARRPHGPVRHRPLPGRVVDEGDTLRFRARVVVCDSSRIDTLLAIPL